MYTAHVSRRICFSLACCLFLCPGFSGLLFAIDGVIDNSRTPISDENFYRYGAYLQAPPRLPEDFSIGVLQERAPRESAVQKILSHLLRILPVFDADTEAEVFEETLETYLSEAGRSLISWHVLRNLELFRGPKFRIGAIVLRGRAGWEVPVRFLFADGTHVILSFLFRLEGSELRIIDIYGDSLPAPYEQYLFSPSRDTFKLGL